MADVPNQTILRRIEDIMQRDGELDDAETGTEMSAGDGHGVDGFGTKLVGELPEIVFRERAELLWRVNRVEKRGRNRQRDTQRSDGVGRASLHCFAPKENLFPQTRFP